MRRSRWILMLLLLSLWLPASSAAQADPNITQYRVTRTTLLPTGQPDTSDPVLAVPFLKAAMTCGVPPGSAFNLGVEIDDPADASAPFNKCHYPVGNAAWTNLTPGRRYRYTIAASYRTDNTAYGPESDPPFEAGRPLGPRGFGVSPTFTGVQVLGTIQVGPFPFPMPDGSTVSVITSYLDIFGAAFPVHLGAPSLGTASYVMRPGHRIAFTIWDPTREPAFPAARAQ